MMNSEGQEMGFSENGRLLLSCCLALIGLAFGAPAAAQISLGTSHTCALSQNGELRCWGRNEVSQLGLGYVSSGAKDYVGKTAAELPSVLPAVEVFP